MIPQKVDGLLVRDSASATHLRLIRIIGFHEGRHRNCCGNGIEPAKVDVKKLDL
jgi:hypothetical protein